MLEKKSLKTESAIKACQRFVSLFVVWCVSFSALVLPVRSAEVPPPPTDVPPAKFRVEKVPVEGGAEIVTIHVRPEENENVAGPATEIPLISILRDTLGDENPANDRLRYVWLHTYTRASFAQKAAAVVPFLYTRTTNAKKGDDPPPALIDMNSPRSHMWDKIFWFLFQRMVVDDAVLAFKLPLMSYRQNAADQKRSAVAAAMTVMSLYHEIEGEKLLSETEMRDIQARLSLTTKPLGWHMQKENLGRVYAKEMTLTRDMRAQNWELLRQHAEAQGLYFEPMVMPDETTRHAIVWTSASDVAQNRGKKFDGRFLNFKNPWDDKRLTAWKGYSEERWFDADGRVVEPETPGATAQTMIPLAIYGLDNPKIPSILVDFRDNGNPKKREMSKRILHDITNNVLALSRFHSFSYFFGRLVYEYVTAKRGMDLNQESRLRSYAQLKLLLSLDASLDPDFRKEVAKRVESATLNPLENDTATQTRLARVQYENLLTYAKRSDGLPKKLANDRREEMVSIKHGRMGRTMAAIGRTLSFGLYVHRETATPELLAQMDTKRQLEFHERNLREIAFASARPEIDANMESLRESLEYISKNGSAAKAKTSKALAKIFAMTNDNLTRTLCVTGLYRINNSSAKKTLLAIHADDENAEHLRALSAQFLKLALEEGQRISKRDAETIASLTAN